MANIKDIAEKAGVSVTTVSRVINNHPYVSEDKRKRVFEAMESLEYTRNIHSCTFVERIFKHDWCCLADG